jgi:hypothetical protein
VGVNNPVDLLKDWIDNAVAPLQTNATVTCHTTFHAKRRSRAELCREFLLADGYDCGSVKPMCKEYRFTVTITMPVSKRSELVATLYSLEKVGDSYRMQGESYQLRDSKGRLLL